MVIIMLFFVFFFALFMVIINFFLKDVWKDENGEKEISATLLSILKKRNSGQSIEQHKLKMGFGRMRIYVSLSLPFIFIYRFFQEHEFINFVISNNIKYK
eukprot:GHVP01029801.1.p1 GENE.GHVP01029801.1~~GHVP01029801.1.p1  ORF type:complete len:100 (+),score=10.42 GHVP01029801.1:137-436(+)